jgi:hypothetical protein
MPPRKADGPERGRAPYFVRPDGRIRDVPYVRKRERPVPRPKEDAPEPPPRLTGRGGVLAIVVFSFAGTMVAHWAGVPSAPGAAFTLACLLGAFLVRPSDLLSLSVSPPIAFFVAVAAAESVLALGSEGFARVLFLGTALVLVIGVFRGLPGNIRDLGDQLNGRR